jgi:hypothetical protein
MIEIGLEEPTGRTIVPLALRATRGSATGAPVSLDTRIIVGDPAVRRLSPDAVGEDDELRMFVADEAIRTAYWLVQFTCSFEHDDDLPFTKAWVQLELTSDGGKAVAHSMEPARQSVNRTIHWKASLTVPCVLVGLEAEGDHVTGDVFCEASAEGSPKPSWRFYGTRSSEIRGPQRLRLVVRTPSNGSLSATARIGATATHRRLGLRDLSYQAAPDAMPRWLETSRSDPPPDGAR